MMTRARFIVKGERSVLLQCEKPNNELHYHIGEDEGDQLVEDADAEAFAWMLRPKE